MRRYYSRDFSGTQNLITLKSKFYLINNQSTSPKPTSFHISALFYFCILHLLYIAANISTYIITLLCKGTSCHKTLLIQKDLWIFIFFTYFAVYLFYICTFKMSSGDIMIKQSRKRKTDNGHNIRPGISIFTYEDSFLYLDICWNSNWDSSTIMNFVFWYFSLKYMFLHIHVYVCVHTYADIQTGFSIVLICNKEKLFLAEKLNKVV